MSLLFNMLSRLAITFLPRSKRLLISWLQSDAYTWHLVVHLERPKDWCWSWNSNTLATWLWPPDYYGDPFVICKDSEGSKVFPCLQTNKFPCYRLTETSRRPRPLGHCHRVLLATDAELPGQHRRRESACRCGRCEMRGAFLSWKSPWSRKWQYAPVFLPRELENSMDRGAWRDAVHGVAKSQTRLRTWLEWWSVSICIHTPIPQEPQFQLLYH